MKRYPKLLAVIVGIALIVSMLSACTPTAAPAGNPTAAPAAATTDITVAGIVFQEDQFMKLLSLGYQDAAKAAGVKCLTANTSNDQAKEADLISTYIGQKVGGIAIAPLNQDSSVAALQKADAAGVKISVTNINLSNGPFIVGGFTSNNENIGAVTGEACGNFIKEKLSGKANIAILEYKAQFPKDSTDRVNGFKNAVLKVCPDVQFVADQDAWLQDKAVQVAGDIITAHPEINIIWAANEGGTIGATMAVKNAGKAGKIFTFGTDASDQLISMLKDTDNILQGITGQDPYSMGYKAMEILIKGIKGEDVSASKGKTTIVPGILLSRSDPAAIAKFEADIKAKMGTK